jgi:hypothetical protein
VQVDTFPRPAGFTQAAVDLPGVNGPMRTNCVNQKFIGHPQRAFACNPFGVGAPGTMKITPLQMVYQPVAGSILGIIEAFLKYLYSHAS